MEKYDLIIIGGAAAGLAAALYASRRHLKTLVLTENIAGQAGQAKSIENYPGFKEISGYELMSRFEEQAKNAGAKILLEKVTGVKKKDRGFEVRTQAEKYEAGAVIIAAGKAPRTLEVLGEERLKGRGVSYCATCDGPFFKGKTLAVIGGGNAALEEAEYLSKIAKKVYLVHRRSVFRAEETIVSRIKNTQNIELVLDSVPVEIKGDKKVEALVVENLSTKTKKSIPLDGIFVSIGYVPRTEWLKGEVKLDSIGQIKVNEKCETTTKGIFASGDITNLRDKQIIVAAAQGVTAALSVYDYIVGKKRW